MAVRLLFVGGSLGEAGGYGRLWLWEAGGYVGVVVMGPSYSSYGSYMSYMSHNPHKQPNMSFRLFKPPKNRNSHPRFRMAVRISML